MDGGCGFDMPMAEGEGEREGGGEEGCMGISGGEIQLDKYK